MVQECAEGLRDAEEALRTAKESYAMQLEDAASLDKEADDLYELASTAVQAGDDDAARGHLTERKRVQARLDDAKLAASQAKGRVERVEQTLEMLATQARRLEGILKTNMAEAAEVNAAETAARLGASDLGGGGGGSGDLSSSSLELEDPLEKKFRELEGR